MQVCIVGGGVSGLATAYELQTAARRHGRPLSLRLFESAQRLGGKVDTRCEDGFVIEGGVNGWLASKVVVDELATRIGLGPARVEAQKAAKRRYLWKGSGLVAIPTDPLAFVRSPLLGLGGKLRLFYEPLVRRHEGGEETVADFIRRRLGEGALQDVVDPLVSGVYAGDPEQLSLQSAFPNLAAYEHYHGGMFQGLVAKMRSKKGHHPRTGLVSFKRGVAELTEHLGSLLEAPPETGTPVVAVEKGTAGFVVKLDNGERVSAEQVVIATPAFAAAKILGDLDDTLARELSGIPYAPIAVVALAWRRDQIEHALDGFGFLVPGREGRDILGTLWDSSVFASRAPLDYALMRVMIGGARRPELVDRDDDTLLATATDALRATIGITQKPELVRVIRHRRGIPQYVIGHAARFSRIRSRFNDLKGLHLAGNAYHGISLADCVAAAPEVAKRVLGLE